MSAVKQLCYESRVDIYQQFFVLCNEIGFEIAQYQHIYTFKAYRKVIFSSIINNVAIENVYNNILQSSCPHADLLRIYFSFHLQIGSKL